jgi:cytochrome c-type biogenesis protein CcmH
MSRAASGACKHAPYVLALALALFVTPALAVDPSEVLADPALEARARALSKELRCVVCRSESIDESHAEIAGDIRRLVRERLVAGDTDEEVLAAMVARYGEFVLLKPTTTGANWVLWLAGPGLLVLGGGLAAVYLRGRKAAVPETRLTAEEEAALRRISSE